MACCPFVEVSKIYNMCALRFGNKKLFKYILCTLLGITSFSSLHAQIFDDNLLKVARTFDWLSKYYVDTINREQLVEKAISSMLKGLDPHSSYLNRKEAAAIEESMKGGFYGIGVSYFILDDTVYVLNAIVGRPAYESGIRSGDRIITVNSKKVAGVSLTTEALNDMLKGENGTEVWIGVKRKGSSLILDFPVTRGLIDISSIDAAYMVDSANGYIRLNRFSQNTSLEVLEAIDTLKRQGMQNLVLDLRDNGGGSLAAAIDLADDFLKERKLIVYTQGAHEGRNEYKSGSDGVFEDGKLILLVNEESASASEILAGAIQDWDRGIIIGRRSFGKGLVQRQFLYDDGAMVRMTIARYYTPSGRLIQKSYLNGYDDYSKDLRRRSEQGELLHADSIHFPDSLKFYTLQAKRVVYGGGGIMPDFFVPIDTNYMYLINPLMSKGLINKFSIVYVDRYRELLGKYADFNQYNQFFQPCDSLWNEFATYIATQKYELSKNISNEAKKEMLELIKAYIARSYWDNNEFYQVLNKSDNDFAKALEVIRNNQLYLSRLSK